MRRTTVAVEACPDDDTLGALVAGALSEDAREALAIHAAGCAPCHAMIDRLAASVVGTSDELADAEAVPWLELRPGAQVGRYTIAQRLGAGGMGLVYQAVDAELQRQVALKVLRRGRGTRGARDRLVREARTLARLSHPNVVAVFDVGEHRGHVFIVMELIAGGTVATWLASRPRRVDDIIGCMIDAGRGLSAAHARALVHRDVKPDNLLVGADGRVRVTDFGLALFGATTVGEPSPAAATVPTPVDEARLTRAGSVLGTPAYMAPEASRGDSGALADQWAFCATLYELLAGVRPFPTEPEARAAAIAAGRLAPPAPGRTVPTRLRRVIARGLRAAPEERWPDMAAVVTALVRARNRPRNLALGAAAAVVLAVGGTATGLALRDPPPAPVRRMTWLDQRPGCGCPLSACAGRCTSVCAAPGYHVGARVPGLDVRGRQEALQGASADGQTLLYLAGARCAIDRVWLARRRGDRFVPIELTAQLTAAGAAIFEGCCTLSADGQALVLTTADQQRFVQARLAGDRLLPPTPLFDPHLPAVGGRPRLRAPVLAADGRTLYYRVDQDGIDGDVGELAGTYQAQRLDPGAPFAVGARIPGIARRYEYVSGVSSDGRSLFMAREWHTYVLVRTDLDRPFVDPAPSVAATELEGWRAVPLADCRRIVTTWSPGGCESEDLVFIDADD